MAASGSSAPTFQAWVALVAQGARRGGKPLPVKLPRALALANRVSNRRRTLGEATCITEMSLMMACWKQNEFSEAPCDREIQAFLKCAAHAEAEHKAKLHQESLGQSGSLSSKQVNKLLNRFPNINHYY